MSIRIIIYLFIIQLALAETDDRNRWHENFKIYHKVEEFEQYFDKIEKDENSVLQRKILGEDPKISVFTLKNPPKTGFKFFVDFGMHAREMIASETGLNFLKFLNGDDSKDKYLSPKVKENQELRQFILDNVDIAVVPIVNVEGHKKVEQGFSCWRSVYNDDPKKNKIDPNRNWAATHQKSSEEDKSFDSNGGDKPFTINETKYLNDFISEFKPQVYLDIHSGMKGMLYPRGAESTDITKYNTTPEEMKAVQKIQNKLLFDVQQKFCTGCLYGEAYSTIKYDSFGSAIDHMFFQHDITLATTWEIYGDNSTLRILQQQIMRLKKQQANLKGNRMRFIKKKQELQRKAKLATQDLISNSICIDLIISELRMSKTKQADEFDCFTDFNPKTAREYKKVVDNWTQTISEYIKMTYEIKDQISDIQNKRSKRRQMKAKKSKNKLKKASKNIKV